MTPNILPRHIRGWILQTPTAPVKVENGIPTLLSKCDLKRVVVIEYVYPCVYKSIGSCVTARAAEYGKRAMNLLQKNPFSSSSWVASASPVTAQ
jgi:hypothetical protein